jgi:hypothetical protein
MDAPASSPEAADLSGGVSLDEHDHAAPATTADVKTYKCAFITVAGYHRALFGSASSQWRTGRFQ